MSIRANVYIHVCTNVYTHLCTHVCTNVYTHVYTPVCTQARCWVMVPVLLVAYFVAPSAPTDDVSVWDTVWKYL